MNQSESGNNKVSTERYAPHLSEFYSIMNSNNNNIIEQSSPTHVHLNSQSITNSKFAHSRSRSSTRRASSIGSNAQSVISDLQTLITRRDVKSTKDAMFALNNTANEFSKALSLVSRYSSAMALQLENLAKLKGCNDDTAEKFMNASGLFHLLGNHELIMRNFVNDLLVDSVSDMTDEFQFKSKKLENDFSVKCKEESLKLKIQEKYNNEFSRKNVRNLISYRESLNNLQSQLDQLETLKYDYYNDSYLLVESTCNKVLRNVASVTRAQVEISENIARKGWSGGGLDELLIDAEDPFSKAEDLTDQETRDNEYMDNEEEEDEEVIDGNNTMDIIPENEEINIQNKETGYEPGIKLRKSVELIKSNSKDNSPLNHMSSNNEFDNIINSSMNTTRTISGAMNSTNTSYNSVSDEGQDVRSDTDDDNDNSFALPESNSAGARTSSIIKTADVIDANDSL